MEVQFKITDHVDLAESNGKIIGFQAGWRTIYFNEYVSEINDILRKINNKKHFDFNDVSDNKLNLILNLYELGLIDFSSHHIIDWDIYHNHIISHYRTRRFHLLKSSFNKDIEYLNEDNLKKYFLEAYYLINNVSKHIITAYNSLSEKNNLKEIDHYLEEEWWHGKLLFYGLRKSGIDEETIKHFKPSTHTSKLLNFLCNLAEKDFQSYALCMSITESPVNTPGYITSRLGEWRKIEEKSTLSRELIKFFRIHEEYDLIMGHGNFSKKFDYGIKEINPERQIIIQNNIEEFLQNQMNIYDSLNQ